MELTGSIFLVLALALVVGLFIARPLLERQSKADKKAFSAGLEREHQRSALLAERDRVLTALQELDFDYALGKVPAEEYPAMRTALLRSGASVLRQLDTLQPEEEAAARTAEDRIEAAVAARRADAARGAISREQTAPLPEVAVEAAGTNGRSRHADDLEDIIAARKRSRNESAGGFCPRCGKPVQKSDKFCSKCGTPL